MIRTQFLCGLACAVSLQFGPLRNSAHAHSAVFLAATGGQVAVGEPQ